MIYSVGNYWLSPIRHAHLRKEMMKFIRCNSPDGGGGSTLPPLRCIIYHTFMVRITCSFRIKRQTCHISCMHWRGKWGLHGLQGLAEAPRLPWFVSSGFLTPSINQECPNQFSYIHSRAGYTIWQPLATCGYFNLN